MKLHFLYYSHPADFAKLALSVESVRRIYGDVRIDVYLPDGNGLPDRDDVCVFEIPHAGPIAGRDFCAGHLRRLIECARTCGADYLVKLDSDVLAIGNRWLEHLDRFQPVLYGQRNTLDAAKWGIGYNHAYGGAYAIRCDALRVIDPGSVGLLLQILASAEGNFRGLWAEDEVTSRLMSHVGPCILTRDEAGASGMLALYDFAAWRHQQVLAGGPDEPVTESSLRPYLGFDFIEFGRVYPPGHPQDFLPGWSPEARHALRADAMLRAAQIVPQIVPRGT